MGLRVCYLPHHGVVKGYGVNTKIRVVNGSFRLQDGTFLNKNLMTGPNLLPKLSDVVTRWRRHQYVITADIEKMYRQILVQDKDRDLQRILWKTKDEIHEYRLNMVTYGLASAPYLAIRTLRQLATDEGARLPLAVDVLRRDTYVDDILSGAAKLEDARLRDELITLCMAGGFLLRKWAANHSLLREDIPADQYLHWSASSSLLSDSHSVLGLRWDSSDDCFVLAVREPATRGTTK